jgi:sec-independent protein translocase protein TatC
MFRNLWRLLTVPFRATWRALAAAGRGVRGIYREIRQFITYEAEDSPVTEAVVKAAQNPLEVLEHIGALRSHLLRSTIALLLTSIASFAFAERILDFLARPVGGVTALHPTEISEGIAVYMRISFIVGFAAALPYIVLEFLLFASPGLKRRERQIGCISIPIVSLLFIGGMAFAVFVALEPAINFLADFIFESNLRPQGYYPIVTSIIFWTGVVFEIPVVIYFITAMGLVKAEALRDQARFVIVGLAVLAAAITPTVDPINMLIILAPLILLYYIGVAFAFVAQRGRARRLTRRG